MQGGGSKENDPVDLVFGFSTNAGKRLQEELVQSGPVPTTVLRATQFHEFAEMVVGWTRRGDVAVVPPLLVQPVAASDVGLVVAEIATNPPQGRAPDLAGPETQDLVDMARRALAARGASIRLVPSWRDNPFGVEMAGEVLLPGPGAPRADDLRRLAREDMMHGAVSTRLLDRYERGRRRPTRPATTSARRSQEVVRRVTTALRSG